ncbi:CrcB family protein [Herbiconiux sp. CPCC 203407]|uniref:Fluoride-specific ion channel FluC n=1 Tax=Herbiconiux oxytropis TaxID=2970915 RepID=A0AA41XJL2_9MICO|nr:CrcB family protein [Herbiconiux oxytropis]MCS5722825.1 CrcB family protein [Herbiconiux oxytropis]MCS5727755.1 CrcB family protein [Herbiconiux oxytropis]
MTPLLFAATILAGGLGAGLRYVVDTAVKNRDRTAFPWGTMVINVSGSFALGLLTGLTSAHLVGVPWLTVLGVGLLGGYTTFSTASVESVRLLLARRWAAGLINGLGMLLLATAAAYLGLALGIG